MNCPAGISTTFWGNSRVR